MPQSSSSSASSADAACGITSGKEERLHLLGVSLHWLRTGLREETRQAGMDEESSCIHDLEDLNTPSLGIARRKGPDVVCPVDSKMGASYLHCLRGNKDHVGQANYMLSYSWSSTFGNIVKSLEE